MEGGGFLMKDSVLTCEVGQIYVNDFITSRRGLAKVKTFFKKVCVFFNDTIQKMYTMQTLKYSHAWFVYVHVLSRKEMMKFFWK